VSGWELRKRSTVFWGSFFEIDFWWVWHGEYWKLADQVDVKDSTFRNVKSSFYNSLSCRCLFHFLRDFDTFEQMAGTWLMACVKLWETFDLVWFFKLDWVSAQYQGASVHLYAGRWLIRCEAWLCVLQDVNWTDGKCAMPTSCPVGECRSRTFNACRNHLLTETIDWQTIRYVDPVFASHLIHTTILPTVNQPMFI